MKDGGRRPDGARMRIEPALRGPSRHLGERLCYLRHDHGIAPRTWPSA